MVPTAVDAASQSAPARQGRPGSPTRPWAWVVLGLLGAVVIAGWVRTRVEHELERQPLEAVERASAWAHKPVAVLSPALAARWDADGPGPTEKQLRDRSVAGNAYLEPVFFSLFSSHGQAEPDPEPADGRCYYFPVQRGRDFDASRVTAVMRFCYADGTQQPYLISTTSLVD